MAVKGKGTLLQLSISSVFTTIADRVTISGPSLSVGTSDTTTLDDDWKRHIPTIPDGGELSMTINYDPSAATHQALTDLFTDPEVQSWKLIFSTDPAVDFEFDGSLTGFEPGGMEVDGHLTADITIKVDDVVTLP